MRHRRRAATLVLAALSLGALQGSSCIEAGRPYTAPKAAELVAAVEARARKVRTIRAETRMSHRTSQGKIKATVRLMARRGGALRFDAVTPFDTPLATFVSDGETFGLVDAQKKRHFHGPASPCNIARLLGVVLKANDVLTILGGSTPLIPHDSASVSWDARARVEVLTLKNPAMTQTVRLDGTGRRWDLLFSQIKDLKGQVVLQIEPGAMRRVDGIRAPRSLRVTQPKHKAELELTYRKLELNLKLPAAAFVLPEAGGLPSQRVECHTVIKK